MTATRIAVIAVALGLVAGSLRSATPAAQPAAMVYGLKGSATMGTPESKKPAQLFAWIPAGDTVEVAAGSTVTLAFANGTRYELGPVSSSRVGTDRPRLSLRPGAPAALRLAAAERRPAGG